jgi:WD40 repeat protein
MNTNSHTRYFPENKPITQLKICKNTFLAAIGYKHGSIVILNVEIDQMKIVHKFKCHEDAINYLYWNPNDKTNDFSQINDNSLVLCSSSEDKTIRFWSIENGTEIKFISAPTSGHASRNNQQKSSKISFTPLCWPTSRYILSASYK